MYISDPTLKRHRKAASFAYRCVNGLKLYIFKDYFKTLSYGKVTRGDTGSLKLSSIKFKYLGKAFSSEEGWLFKKLPNEPKTENSLLHFKIKLGEHFN